jgi:hypothetical protein
MKENECNICLGRHCEDIFDRKGGKPIGRVKKTNSFPLDRSTPETSKIPIKGCSLRQAHLNKVEEAEEASKTQ